MVEQEHSSYGFKISVEGDFSPEEVNALVEEEKALLEPQGKEIGHLSLRALEGKQVEIKVIPKSPIRRVRRITGYLSNIENFNSAKQAECRDRLVHFGGD